MLDKRLAALSTDYVDLFFIHGLGDDHGADDAINFVKSQEFKETADAIRKSGKAKFVGFSTHHKDRAAIIQAAADAGIVDAIMLQYTPWLDKDAPLNKALDACHKKGIGLISMKQVAGQFPAPAQDRRAGRGRQAGADARREEAFTRIRACCTRSGPTSGSAARACRSRRPTSSVKTADAARRYEPLTTAEIRELRDAALAFGPTMCADCDGRCSIAAGTKAELGNLTRFLTYHEHHGIRSEARRQYAALSAEARDWSGADLEAARAACPNKLDFAALLPEVDRRLA